MDFVIIIGRAKFNNEGECLAATGKYLSSIYVVICLDIIIVLMRYQSLNVRTSIMCLICSSRNGSNNKYCRYACRHIKKYHVAVVYSYILLDWPENVYLNSILELNIVILSMLKPVHNDMLLDIWITYMFRSNSVICKRVGMREPGGRVSHSNLQKKSM